MKYQLCRLCHLTLFQMHEITSSCKKYFFTGLGRISDSKVFLQLSKHFIAHDFLCLWYLQEKNLFYISPLMRLFSNHFKCFVYRVPLRLDDSCFKSLSTIVTLFSDPFAEGIRNLSLQLVCLLFYFGLQYNSKSKTCQNGFVMALERTADNKRNNADYMRNNLRQFYFKYLHIKNWIQNVFCLFSCILQ